MPRKKIAAAVAAAALAGGGAGAGVYAVAAGSSAHVVTTRIAAGANVADTSSALSVGALYTQSVPGIVEIDSTIASPSNGQGFGFGFGGQGGGSATAEGTGFVYDTAGHILTNEHVVDGASSVKVHLHDGSTVTATVVGADPSTDVAVLKVNVPASKLHPLTLGDSGAVQVGDGVVAIGNPFGLDDTATAGIVSAVGREITAPDNSPIEGAIQTDAAINHGNSGGPLFDLQGRVIGITSQIQSDSGGSDGVGFAIPSNLVKKIADELIAHGKVDHPMLGVQVQTIPAEVASQLGEPAGVAVATVQPRTGAAAAGLQAATGSSTVGGQRYPTGGDVITAIDGKQVSTAQELRAAIDAHKVADTLDLTVVHGGKTRTVHAKLGARGT
jgi:S1-C subfamily serine protease